MKRLFNACALLLALALPASASLVTNFNSGFANGGLVADGNLSGWTDTRNLNITEYAGFTVTDVQVTLDISGGWNGDLYGYLVHDSGFVVLLDRVGSSTYSPYGYGNAGFTSVVLSDTVNLTGNIEDYGGAGGPSVASSALAGGTYNSQDGTLNTAFDGLSVNGNWTLFLADMSTGDISQVNGWSLSIEAVPEPTTWALLVASFGFVCWQLRPKRAPQS